MNWKLPILAAAAILLAAAAPPAAQKAAPKPAPAKAAPAKAAPQKAAPQKTASSAFDARDPASLSALLSQMGAKAQVMGRAGEDVDMKVTTPAYGFAVHFTGCTKAGQDCKAVAFTTQAGSAAPTLAQINGFNQSSITCKAWQDKGGKPHVMYSAMVTSADTRDEMQMHVGAWQGCLASFGEFLMDPPGYLASAP